MPFEAKLGTDHHTAMRVKDLEGAVKWYGEVVGLKEQRRQGDPNWPTGVFLPAIQLIRAESQDVSEKGVLDHVGVIVTNIVEIVENLKKHGVEIENGRINEMPTGVKTCFFRDVEGNRIELVQRP